MTTEEDDRNADQRQQELIRNEQLKARSTYLNGLAVAVFAVGALAPLASAVVSAAPPTLAASTLGFVCGLMSLALHSLATAALRKLKP